MNKIVSSTSLTEILTRTFDGIESEDGINFKPYLGSIIESVSTWLESKEVITRIPSSEDDQIMKFLGDAIATYRAELADEIEEINETEFQEKIIK